MRRALLLGLGVALVAVSCADEEAPAPSGAGAAVGVTYQKSVRPILEASCGGCHSEGGLAPIKIGYDAAEWASGPPSWASLAVNAVEQGRMPPWMPSADCQPLANERRLKPDEVATLKAWKAAGYPRGNEGDYQPPGTTKAATPVLGAPTYEVSPVEPYTASRALPDDYRCFLLPQEFTEDTFLISSTVEPSERSIAHHALLYLMPPGAVAGAKKAESEDPEPGYSCFGGPGGGALTTLGAWVPGAVQTRTPVGAAMVIPKGSRVVLQMHYNTLAVPAPQPVPAERARVALWTQPSSEKPTHRIELLPFAHLRMSVDPLDAASKQERVFTMPSDGTLVAMGPHMHKLGQSIRAQLEPEGGAARCLVDIPRWDFNWQQQYTFPEDQQVPVKKGDRLRLSCVYDNSKGNQPVVNGVQQESKKVTWGEGTLDEMCLAFGALMVPYDAPDFRCGSFDACRKKCDTGDGACFFDCATEGGGQCANALITAVGQCAPPFCPGPGLKLQQCFKGCDDPIKCMANDCAPAYNDFYACMEPHLLAGECNDKLSQCGVQY